MCWDRTSLRGCSACWLGVLLTTAARVVLRKYNLAEALNPPLLMYSCLTALFTFATWLIFFRT